MQIDLTFEDVRQLVEDDDTQILETTEKISSILLALSTAGLAMTGGLPPDAIGWVASLIAVKDETTKGINPLLLNLRNRVIGKEAETHREREQRMAAAYVLICYAAYFDTLETTLPDLMNRIQLKDTEKIRLTERAQRHFATADVEAGDSSPAHLSSGTSLKFQLPHPAENFESIEERLLPVYKKLNDGFNSFLKGLVIWEEAKPDVRKDISEQIANIPSKALIQFHTYYFELARTYNDFYIWASIHAREETQQFIRQLDLNQEERDKSLQVDIRRVMDFIETLEQQIDVGFDNLNSLIQQLPEAIANLDANEALKVLKNRYARQINERIIKDESVSEENAPNLTYPRRSEIFIPQSYKYLRYNVGKRLEDNATWSQTRSNNLGGFLISYLRSPYSHYKPLIVLGHPGSGKSMLTRFIATRLQSTWFMPIRIELRQINAELSIRDQIEQQIEKISGNRVSWGDLRRVFDGHPMIVIFDGYDELLQASGKKFSGYLREIEEFQEESYRDHRQPVLAIVTSRITLIDQAAVPKDSTVIRLEPFDKVQQGIWIDIWNKTNQQYFEDTGVKPFSIPDSKSKPGELAEQPLLLLMLAMYDSVGNSLHQHSNLNRTSLYNSLLRRFIERERRKDDELKSETDKLEQAIETDMERLGAVAISMFNRRALDIQAEELNTDLSYFDLARSPGRLPAKGGSKLSQGEMLFGSFFFVYKSETSQEGISGQQAKDQSYEFLHNTFGEFLTADFILRTVFTQVAGVHESSQSKWLRGQLPEKLKTLSRNWFVTLIYTPLFSRPVVLDMMREWLVHYEEKNGITRDDFLNSLKQIVDAQLYRILMGREYPPILLKDEKNSFEGLPLMGHAAIYTMNLMLVSAVLSPNGHTFEQSSDLTSADGTLPWERLINLWRSWFSIERLNEVTAILDASYNYDEEQVLLTARDDFNTSLSTSKLDMLLNVSIALADQVNIGLFGLLTHYPHRTDNTISLAQIQHILEQEAITDFNVNLVTHELIRLRADEYRNVSRSMARVISSALRVSSFQDFFNKENMLDFNINMKIILRSISFTANNAIFDISKSADFLYAVMDWIEYAFRGDKRRYSNDDIISIHTGIPDALLESIAQNQALWMQRPDVVIRALSMVEESALPYGIRFLEAIHEERLEQDDVTCYSYALLLGVLQFLSRIPSGQFLNIQISFMKQIIRHKLEYLSRFQIVKLLLHMLILFQKKKKRYSPQDNFWSMWETLIREIVFYVDVIALVNEIHHYRLLIEFLKSANDLSLNRILGDRDNELIELFIEMQDPVSHLPTVIQTFYQIQENGYQLPSAVFYDALKKHRSNWEKNLRRLDSSDLTTLIQQVRAVDDSQLTQTVYRFWSITLDEETPEQVITRHSLAAIAELKWLAGHSGDTEMVAFIEDIVQQQMGWQ